MSTVLANKLKTKSNDTTRKQLRKCTLNDLALVEDSLNNIVENDELEMVLSDYVKIKELGNLIYGDTPIVQQGLTEKDLSALTVPIKTTATLTVDGDSNFGKIIVNNITTHGLTSIALTTNSLTAQSLSTSSAQNIQIGTSSLQQYLDAIDVGLTEEDLSALTVPIKTTSKLDVTGKTTLQNVAISGKADVDSMSAITLTASTQYSTNLTTDNLSSQKLTANNLSSSSVSANGLSATNVSANSLSATNVSANSLSANSISTQDLTSQKHGLVGNNVDFSTGGDSVFVVGNNHSIYGKESFVAGNEGNIIGAKAFHWKAIDTTNNLIYLTTEKDKIKFNSTKLSSSTFLSGTSGNYVSKNTYRKYDIPYFGQKDGADPAISAWLFTADTNLSILKENVQVGTTTILGAKGKQLILNNVFNEPYMRKLTVLSVINGSVLSVSGLENIDDGYKQTHYRKNATNQTYHANHYIACFPDIPLISTNSDVGCENNMTFGCAAIGEANNTIGYNSFAIGRSNTAEGNYSMALGYNARAKNNNSFAWSGGDAYSVSGVGQFGINPKGGINGFYIGDKTLGEYIGDPQYMLDKRHGGVVSGDIGILCGNYVQVTDDKNVYNYSEKNAFIQAEEAFNGSGKSYGPAHTGSYGYCILSVVMNASGHGFKLSGPLDKLISLTANNVDGAGIKYNPKNGCSKALSIVLGNSTDISNAMFSLALSNQGEPLAYQISSIDEAAGIVYVKQPFSSGTSALTTLTEAQCKDLFDGDDNALYVPGYPEIGNLIMKTFYAQHVEGGSSRAVGKYTHAEGRDNLADVRYAHVEGAHNIAAGMASHAEGFSNKVLGRYSHVEGYLNTTKGDYSHAAGICAVADANCQYVWNGIQTHTYHAENDGTFNINPKNGMAGIYIGHHSLAEMSLPVSSLSTTVVYNNGTVSTLAIENNLLSSSIPNKKNAIDITIGNAVENIGIQAFRDCSSLTNIIIPNSVSAIQNQAFYQCSNLTGISFPDSVLAIDYSAMSKCYNLRTVKLPNKLQRLADYTFYSCSSLIDVHIPNSVSAIGQRNFDSCSKLVHVNVPNATLSIGVSAFINCPNLNSVEFEYKTMDQIANIKNYHTATLDRWGIADENAIKPYDQTYKSGYFNTNPNNGLSGFYINDKNFMQCMLAALNDTNFRAEFKSALNAIINS